MEPREKFSRPIFLAEQREGGEGTKFPYVLYSYFHKIYTGIPVGQLLLCRRSLTWDKGLRSVLAAGDLDRSLENHRVFHENLYIRR